MAQTQFDTLKTINNWPSLQFAGSNARSLNQPFDDLVASNSKYIVKANSAVIGSNQYKLVLEFNISDLNTSTTILQLYSTSNILYPINVFIQLGVIGTVNLTGATLTANILSPSEYDSTESFYEDLSNLLRSLLPSYYTISRNNDKIEIRSKFKGEQYNLGYFILGSGVILDTEELATGVERDDQTLSNFKLNVDVYKQENYNYIINEEQHLNRDSNYNLDYLGKLSQNYQADNNYNVTLSDLLRVTKNKNVIPYQFNAYAYHPNAFYKFVISTYNSLYNSQFFTANVIDAKINNLSSREVYSKYLASELYPNTVDENNRRNCFLRFYYDTTVNAFTPNVNFYQIGSDYADIDIILTSTASDFASSEVQARNLDEFLIEMQAFLDYQLNVGDLSVGYAIDTGSITYNTRKFNDNFGYIQVTFALTATDSTQIRVSNISIGPNINITEPGLNGVYKGYYESQPTRPMIEYMNNYRYSKPTDVIYSLLYSDLTTESQLQTVDMIVKEDSEGEVAYASTVTLSAMHLINLVGESETINIYTAYDQIYLIYDDGTLDIVNGNEVGSDTIIQLRPASNSTEVNGIATINFTANQFVNAYYKRQYNGAKLKQMIVPLALKSTEGSNLQYERYVQPAIINIKVVDNDETVTTFVYKNHLGGFDSLSVLGKVKETVETNQLVLNNGKVVSDLDIFNSNQTVINKNLDSTYEVEYVTNDIDEYNRLKDLVDSEKVYLIETYYSGQTLALEVLTNIEYKIEADNRYVLNIKYKTINKNNNNTFRA